MNNTPSVDVGCVLKTHVDDTHPPKIKRFIVVGKDDKSVSLATIYINSEINENVNWSIEQKALQLEFDTANRAYLNHKSYVDCSKLYFKDYSIINGTAKENPQIIIGQVSDNDMRLITETLANAITIKGKYKKKYGIYKQDIQSID